ncbi:MAG: WYL domain-containing protein [Spirochaetaceae bacterium]
MATLRSGRKYWIRYRNGEGEESERVIHVRSVTPGAYGRSYIRAFCELAQEERTFRLDRMTYIEPLHAPLSETTPVTPPRNSSYLASGSEAARTAPAAAPAGSAAPRHTTPEENHGFRRFLLKAAALFILFDFVIAEDPGTMSARVVEAVESAVDSYEPPALPARVTSLWGGDEADSDFQLGPTPERAESETVAKSVTVSTSRELRVAGAELPSQTVSADPEKVPSPAPAGWVRVSRHEYQGAAIDLLLRNGEGRFRVPRTGRSYDSLREARRAIRMDRLLRKGGVTDELVIKRYDRVDLDGDDELSWSELRQFQREVYRDFRYESNGKALRPEEFFVAGGGDCEDFAIFSAAMLTYWGWDAYVASMSTNDNDAHAVVFIKVDQPPSWASYYEIPSGTAGNPRFAASGTFVPVDYDVVGDVTNAVTPGSRVTDIVVVNAWYGLPI